jgi:hypothetical protein
MPGGEPKTEAEMWSEWFREASVLIAVFGAVLDPLIGQVGRVPEAVAGLLPPAIVDPADGKISFAAWFVVMAGLAVAAQLTGLNIEKARK